jgi:hypothetical protein
MQRTTCIMRWSNNHPLSMFFFFVCICITFQVSLSQTGCALCASTGDCSQAFHYGPGKYCGTFHDFTTTKPCCCPNNSQCQVSATQCNCYVNGYGNNSYHSGGYNSNGGDTVGGIITMLVLICFCFCCCSSCCLRSNIRSQEVSGEYIPIAVPYNGDDGNPPPTAPDYQATARAVPAPSWGSSRSDRGFAWGPALGGFIVGEMFGSRGRNNGNHRHHHHGERFGGGGFSIPGDSSGGGDGGFTIRGDS